MILVVMPDHDPVMTIPKGLASPSAGGVLDPIAGRPCLHRQDHANRLCSLQGGSTACVCRVGHQPIVVKMPKAGAVPDQLAVAGLCR